MPRNHIFSHTFLAGSVIGLACWPTLAADLIGIRCTDYEQELIVINKSLGRTVSGEAPTWHVPKNAQFDVYVDLSRRIGWWDSSATQIHEKKPAEPTADPSMYYLSARLDSWTEWIILDRITGTIDHYVRIDGSQTVQLKRGGKCRKLEPKF